MKNSIIVYPHPILTAKSQPVDEITPEVRETLDGMAELMITYRGIGLAAPQIGILRRLITAVVDDRLFKVVNPVISWQNGEQTDVEGCLSIPNEKYEVSRAQEIVIQGSSPEGREICVLANGLLARVFQHEIDHLEGILINFKGRLYEDEVKAEVNLRS